MQYLLVGSPVATPGGVGDGGERLAAAGLLCTAVALELAPGLIMAAGRLGPRALQVDGGPGLDPTTWGPTLMIDVPTLCRSPLWVPTIFEVKGKFP